MQGPGAQQPLPPSGVCGGLHGLCLAVLTDVLLGTSFCYSPGIRTGMATFSPLTCYCLLVQERGSEGKCMFVVILLIFLLQLIKLMKTYKSSEIPGILSLLVRIWKVLSCLMITSFLAVAPWRER